MRLNCGLTDADINAKGGINQNKVLAYRALPCSATDPWTDFDIDRTIVIPDFEGDVTSVFYYIDKQYNMIEQEMTVKIKHTDGAGMMLPEAAMVDG